MDMVRIKNNKQILILQFFKAFSNLTKLGALLLYSLYLQEKQEIYLGAEL